MTFFKSHVVFTKAQRHGILVLLLLIVVLQCLYLFIDKPKTPLGIDAQTLQFYQLELDSLRAKALEAKQVKIYPFNPNYITDYKGASLGMRVEEIDRLLKYRAENKWVNSAKEFQHVTGISDTVLAKISPYFKFPKRNFKAKVSTAQTKTADRKAIKKDINRATAQDLQEIRGIGAVLSKRIIAYRNKLKGGFVSMIQLQEVYGLTPEVVLKLKAKFKVNTNKHRIQLDLNTATVDELVTIQYVDYEIAHAIVEYRTLHERFTSIDELSKVKEIPLSKLDLIKLSLQIK